MTVKQQWRQAAGSGAGIDAPDITESGSLTTQCRQRGEYEQRGPLRFFGHEHLHDSSIPQSSNDPEFISVRLWLCLVRVAATLNPANDRH